MGSSRWFKGAKWNWRWFKVRLLAVLYFLFLKGANRHSKVPQLVNIKASWPGRRWKWINVIIMGAIVLP